MSQRPPGRALTCYNLVFSFFNFRFWSRSATTWTSLLLYMDLRPSCALVPMVTSKTWKFSPTLSHHVLRCLWKTFDTVNLGLWFNEMRMRNRAAAVTAVAHETGGQLI